MSTLYRDYRPSNFTQVFGQNHVKIALQNEIAGGRLAHAYLFCGPRAVGKTTLARVLAKAINCPNRKEGESEPCDTCSSCLSIAGGTNLDIVEIDAASNTGVDNVRENIIASSRVVSGQVKYRVFIIDEVHMLSISAWNALLKTLEEPPKNVIFILCTTEIHKVPATIISRCERYDFKRISVADIVSKLQNIVSQEKIEVDNDVLEAIARQSGGHLRDAESLLGQVLSLGDKRISWEQAELIIPKYHHHEILELLELISKKDAAKAIKLINQIVDSGINLKNFIAEIVAVLRKILLNKVNPGLSESLGVDLGNSFELKINNLSANLNLDNIVLYLESFMSLYNTNNSYSVAHLPLEIKIIQLCNLDSVISTKNDNNIKLVKPISKKIEVNTEAPVLEIKKEDEIDKIEIVGIASDLNQEMVMAKWLEFLTRIKNSNHSLSFILQNCQAGEIKNGVINLTFKYKFHHDRISDANIKILVEKTLSEVYGGLVTISLAVDENLNVVSVTPELKAPSSAEAENNKNVAPELNTHQTEPNNLLNNLLKTFGGEVIS
jgi:DNA polymerase-3 subunit gamma/tau